jgi:c-di-GMP-binding flagellar brake protein YcgR
MSGLLLAVIVLGLIAAPFLLSRRKKVKGEGFFARLQFYSKGKDSGFTGAEVKILHELARRTHVKHAGSLFWSRVQLDACIRALVAELRGKAEWKNDETQIFLAKIFELRKKLEIERPQNKAGLQSTRDIEKLQPLHVVISGAGVFTSKVLENTRACLHLQRPIGSALPASFVWEGKSVVVYFCRKEDAYYTFDSQILGERLSENDGNTLSLTHAQALQRIQYRNSLRVDASRPAFLYPRGEMGNHEQPTVVSRIKCLLQNLSDTGCAVAVGGTAHEGLPLVVQFTLAGQPVSVSGVIRSVQYDQAKNISLLRIQYDLVPRDVKNLIMCVVLGALHDEPDIVTIQSDSDEEDEDSGAAEGADKEARKKEPKDAAPGTDKERAAAEKAPGEEAASFVWESGGV